MGFSYGYIYDILNNPDSFLAPFQFLLNSAASVLGMLSGVATYILLGLAIMMMGQKLGVKYPWLSWIPVANSYAFGKVAETPDKPRKTGRTMLTLRIVVCGLGILTCVSAVILGVNIALYDHISDSPAAIIISSIMTVALLMGMAGVAIAYSVVYYMAFYRITKLFAGEKYLTYFLLGFIPVFIGLSVATPIVLMVLASKEPNPAAMYPYGFDQFGNVHSNDEDPTNNGQ